MVASGAAHERRVRVKPGPAGQNEVLAGLSPGEYVVTDGAYGLRDGLQVDVRP